MATVGLVAPGAMGSVLGACVVAGGTPVLWSSHGRGEASRTRAARAGLRDVGSLDALCEQADVLLSVCPPHAALDTAREVAARGFSGTYVDANAIAPATVEEIVEIVTPRASFVDGGIIGLPPTKPGTTRLYLAGDGADRIAQLCDVAPFTAIVLDGPVPAASALKVAYAGWNKASTALQLTIRAFAAASGVEDDLLREWSHSHPQLVDRAERLAGPTSTRAWRWVGEMEQIGGALAAVGLPNGFHLTAAEIYRRLEAHKDSEGASLAAVVDDLLGRTGSAPSDAGAADA